MFQTAEQAQQNRKIPLEWRGAEVLVHLVESPQHGSKFSPPTASIVERPIAESIE